MITHVLTNGDAILEIEVSDDKDMMTAVFKQTDPDIYDEGQFVVTRNPEDPFELLRDIIDQCGFMDQPYFTADGWEYAEPSAATVAKLNLPKFSLDFAVITSYPHSVKFSPMLTDRKGVVVEKTPDIIFLKPSHPCYDPDRSPNNLFGKLVSWLADKSIMYDTAQLADYADTIGYLITRN
jgi:hypothetical protein